MRGIGILVYLALAAAALAALGTGERSPVRPVATATAGSFGYANSRGGMPIFSATGIAPGDSATGTVEIANTGEVAGGVVLAQSDVVDVAGTGGGILSGRLSMRIRDVTRPGDPVTVYEGPLAPMPTRPLGRFAPGESRAYEFVATLPEGGSPASPPGGDNVAQGASAGVRYTWTAGADSPAPETTLPSPRPPRLRILSFRRPIRGGRVVVWARCDEPCWIAARGRFRVRDPSGRSRSTAFRLVPRRRFSTKPQRLAIEMSHRLLRALRAAISKSLPVTVRIVLFARDREGDRATARRVTQLRRLFPNVQETRPLR